MGDSAYLVVRNKALVFRQMEQQHEFNFPYQLGTDSPDLPSDGQRFVAFGLSTQRFTLCKGLMWSCNWCAQVAFCLSLMMCCRGTLWCWARMGCSTTCLMRRLCPS